MHRLAEPWVREVMGSVGYYVHHHGAGHLARFRAIAAASTVHLIPVSELSIDGGVQLPSDVPQCAADDATAGGSLHWAPLGPATATPRLRVLVDWFDEARPAAMVIDVSVEAALASRLAGLPTVVVRQHGDRTDPAHRLAYASARRLIAPFPAALDTSTDVEVLAKTAHVGFIAPPVASASRASDGPVVAVGADDAVVAWGAGGGRLSGLHLDALAAGIDGTVYCAGRDIWPADAPPTAPNVVALGWVPSPGSLLTARPLLVGSVGNNGVALAATTRCPFVAVPQRRPFDEQHDLADSLVAAGVAALAPCHPDPVAWAAAVTRARHCSDRWSVLDGDDDDGAARAAAVIASVVDR